MQELCVRCQGKGLCGKPCPIIQKFSSFNFKSHFSGSSPPEIFVGRHNYPYVNAGILSPEELGETEHFGMPELWHKNNMSIEQIISLRSRMVYARFKSKIKSNNKNKFSSAMQEIAMASRHVDAEVFLKKVPQAKPGFESEAPIIGNPAPLEKIRLESNPKIEKKVDYLVADTDAKARVAIQELYNSNIEISNIIKVLSAGLLGLGINRKLVPTRWSITGVDSTISKQLMKEIRYFSLINDYLVFSDEYLGNHYEILLIPQFWSYEVIEAKMPRSVWNISGNETYVMQDYEGFYDRKDYAENVAGGYYSSRLAVSEYLTRIRRQASVLVLREVKPSYTAPCGVGILRETVRSAFRKNPKKFESLKEAFKDIQTRLTLSLNIFIEKSKLLKELTQKTLTDFK